MLQEMIQKAMKFAGEHHSSQTVPGTNANYLLHISNVLMEVLVGYQNQPDFEVELAAQMAVLHDVVEDCQVTIAEIEEMFGIEVAEGVAALTKNDDLGSKSEKIKDSLDRINLLRREVGIVKLADRITNLQEPPKNWSLEKRLEYLDQAKMIAMELEGKHTYLESRLADKILDYNNYCR